MTKISHPRRTRILPPSPIPEAEQKYRQQQRDTLAARCRPIFEQLRPQLIEAHYNWHIAIDPDTEQYFLDPTLNGITQKIQEVYGNPSELKLTIFRLNDRGSCGRLWV